ncbi:unnamed protein product [Paramecium octaurelia]|uniref:Uncharacterized protein n=1 Tax=Paramecium octaurelia TaxID=43137 RepID=A0A8S1W4C3_PAROT|nr:unnamed protein product [Paramecium octaurelia]
MIIYLAINYDPALIKALGSSDKQKAETDYSLQESFLCQLVWDSSVQALQYTQFICQSQKYSSIMDAMIFKFYRVTTWFLQLYLQDPQSYQYYHQFVYCHRIYSMQPQQ